MYDDAQNYQVQLEKRKQVWIGKRQYGACSQTCLIIVIQSVFFATSFLILSGLYEFSQ